MEFAYSYKKSSSVTSGADATGMSFSPDTKRQPTFFRGNLSKAIEFREAMSSLHDVVVSDLRFKPKDKTAYMEWLKKQEEQDVAAVMAQSAEVAERIKNFQSELRQVQQRRQERWAAYYKARGQYYNWVMANDPEARILFDPVITVHPDEIFFECFSKDESTYAKLGTSFNVYKDIGEFACGTTNIDYSHALYDEFQKIRSYKTTQFEIDPSGFEVKTDHEESFKEHKIDVPDSWVRGFLQVSSAMTFPATSFTLHPMDVHNLCFVLRRRKEKTGPRSMRWHLEPGKPVRCVFEPWELEVVCPRSIYEGKSGAEIRVWGRRRILILERLIPVAKSFTVHLLGKGMPTFYVADLGDMSFTLGLSGWTKNDWSQAGNFDLMAPRTEVSAATKLRVFDSLKSTWFATTEELTARLQLDRATVLGALQACTQAGIAIYDLSRNVWRTRELSREPLPLDMLRFSNERELAANALIETAGVMVQTFNTTSTGTEVKGLVNTPAKPAPQPANVPWWRRPVTPPKPVAAKPASAVWFQLDHDDRLVKGDCTCNFHQQNQLRQGPCEHILALRIAFSRRKEKLN
jgi:hypothetical protein